MKYILAAICAGAIIGARATVLDAQTPPLPPTATPAVPTVDEPAPTPTPSQLDVEPSDVIVLPDGKLSVPDRGDGCEYAEVKRSEAQLDLDSDGRREPEEIVVLQAPGCDIFYWFVPRTGSLISLIASAPAPLVSFDGDWGKNATFTWQAVPGAAAYEMQGTIDVLRINAADRFCTPPIVRDTRNVTLDEVIAAPATMFRAPLPEVGPTDEWFVFFTDLRTAAVDAEGNVLAESHGGLTAETRCGREVSALPSLGTGARLRQHDLVNVLTSVGALFTLAGALTLHRRRLSE